MIAIIIPYYKIDYFEQTLHSLSLQTNKNFTVYIGDDASPNSCVPLLKQYEEKIDFIYHRFENNLGNTSLVNHWERCIALSNQEEWLMILGDDDVLAKNVIEEFYKTINKRKSKYELSYYVDNVSYLDLDYWVRLLKEVIRFYSINSLKIYLADEFQNNAQFDLAKFQKDVKSLILAIKIDLIDYIKDGKLVEMFDREAFYQFLIDNNIQSSLLIWAINYIDVESFEEFRDKLFNEAKQEYEE